MNDTDLFRVWKESISIKEKVNHQSPKLLSNMDKEFAKFEHRIKHRDQREIIGAMAFVPIFVLGAFKSENGYEQIACILLIIYSFWVVFSLVFVKYKQPSFSISLSLKEQLIEYRTYILRQQKLVKNVLYWYLFPMLPGIIFFWMGFEHTTLLIASILGVIAFVFLFIYQLNQRAARENYNSLLDELNGAIEKLEENLYI